MRETQTFSKGFAGNPQFRTPRLKIKAARERDAYVIRIAGDLDLFERSRLERASTTRTRAKPTGSCLTSRG